MAIKEFIEAVEQLPGIPEEYRDQIAVNIESIKHRDPSRRPKHLKLFWRAKVEEALKNADPFSDNTIVHKEIKKYLRFMLPRFCISARHKEGQVMLLTYYSTLLTRRDQEHTSGETERDFERLPVSLIDVNDQVKENLGHLAKMVVEAAVEKEEEILLAAPIAADLDETQRQCRPIRDAFVVHIQENPLAPVNLAEALNVDFHLTPPTYRNIIDETLFAGLPINNDKKYKIIRELELSNVLAAYPLFTRQAGEKEGGVTTDITRRLESIAADPEWSIKDIEEDVEALGELVRFDFAEAPPNLPELEAYGIRPENLLKMAVALLRACCPNDKSLTGEQAVALTGLALHEPFQGFDATDLHLGQKLSAHPSLPFFLLMLLWNGTYDDLLAYILPIYLLDVDALHVETVSFCDTWQELLGQVILTMRKDPALISSVLGKPIVGRTLTLRDKVARMIAQNAMGNLVLLRKHPAPTVAPQTTSEHNAPRHECYSCHGHISTLDCSVRSTLVPLRRRERLVEAQRETQRAKDLGRDLIHDLKSKFALLTRAYEFDRIVDFGLQHVHVNLEKFDLNEMDYRAVEQAWESIKQIPWLSIWCQAYHDYYAEEKNEAHRGYDPLTLDQYIAMFAEYAPFERRDTANRIMKALEDCRPLEKISAYPYRTFALIFENLFKNIHVHAVEETLRIEFSVSRVPSLKPSAPEGVWFGVEIEDLPKPHDTPGTKQGTRIIQTMSDYNLEGRWYQNTTHPDRDGKKFFHYQWQCWLDCNPNDIF